MSAPTEAEIEEAAKDLERYSDPGLRETLLSLFKRGIIVVGDRRDGRIVWVAAQILPRH